MQFVLVLPLHFCYCSCKLYICHLLFYPCKYLTAVYFLCRKLQGLLDTLTKKSIEIMKILECPENKLVT